jgi:hypothetical protein
LADGRWTVALRNPSPISPLPPLLYVDDSPFPTAPFFLFSVALRDDPLVYFSAINRNELTD